MTRKSAVAVLVALAVVLAGCGAGVGPGGSETPGDEGKTGTVNFYISDQRNAINDFEHLNVTVTQVGLHRVSRSDDAVTATETEGNELATETAANGSAVGGSESDAGGTASDDESAEWVEYQADNVTVDLTELQGENASQLGVFSAPNGTYDKVFIYVTEVEGTLKNGERVNVKLPSQKLRVNTEFTIGADEELDYVFDVSVFETGQGKYILKPVVSESGAGKKVTEKPAARQGGEKSKDKGESSGEGKAGGKNATDREGGENRSDGGAERNASR